MTEKEMLLKIIDLQNEIISLMKKVTDKIPSFTEVNFTPSTIDSCSDGKYHQYPNPWFSTVPPDCMKCGKASLFPFVSFTTTGTNPVEDEHGIYCGV